MDKKQFAKLVGIKDVNVVKIEGVHTAEFVVYDPPNAENVAAEIKRSLLAGSSVQYLSEDKRTVWYETDWVVKEGTYDPIWHKDGNRIRKKRTEVTLYTDGRIEKQDLGEFWGEYE